MIRGIMAYALIGCGVPGNSEQPVAFMVLLDATKSNPAEDRSLWMAEMDAVMGYFKSARGDRIAMACIQENSDNQREIRLRYHRPKRRLDPETELLNRKALQQFRHEVVQRVESAGNSKRTDVYGALTLAGYYFSNIRNSSIHKVLIVVSDGLHNNPHAAIQIQSRLDGVLVTWVGIDPEQFQKLASEYESKLKAAGAIPMYLLNRSGINSLILGELDLY